MSSLYQGFLIKDYTQGGGLSWLNKIFGFQGGFQGVFRDQSGIFLRLKGLKM